MSKSTFTFITKKIINNKKSIFYYGLKNIENFKLLQNKNINHIHFKKNKKQRIEDLEKCEKIYKELFFELIKILNKINKVNYNSKQWSIIFGRFMKELIYILYKNFHDLEKVLKIKEIKHIKSIPVKDYELVSNNYASFIEAYNSSQWNSKLSTVILKFLLKKKDKHKQLISLNRNRGNLIDKKSEFNFKIKKKLRLIFSNIINIFFKVKKFYFYQTGLNFFFEKRLELKLNEFPSKHIFYEPENIDLKINSNLRNKIKFKLKEKNNFSKFLNEKLHLFLPKFLLEDFNEYQKEIKNNFSFKKLKTIVTGTGFSNECFNFFVAKQVSYGTKFVVLQHGNSYHTNYANDFIFENTVPDNFITWGPKLKKLHIPLFNTKALHNKTFEHKNNKNGNLTVVCNQLSSRPVPYDIFYEKEYCFNKTLKLAKKFPNYIKEKTFFRLFPTNHFGINQILQNNFKNENLSFYHDKIKFSDILKKTKVCLFNYDSTGFYENLLNSIPTICFMPEGFINLNKKAIPIYKKLLNCNILFLDEKKLIHHLSSIWADPYIWWNSYKVQSTIKNFNNFFNKRPNNALNKFYKCIK